VSDAFTYVRASLPPPPARVLEIGAGNGELARALGDAGYRVLAIDPAATVPSVEPVALLDVTEPAGSFDAAVACMSLHHVEPLAESCARLADLLRPEGRLVADEFDVDRFDERAARWWIEGHTSPEELDSDDAATVVGKLRDHIHPIDRVIAELQPWFAVDEPRRGPYLYRWDLPPGLEPAEREAIGSEAIQATGIRFTATRTA
jgi:SAM-dependent methyltransferase